MDLIFWVVRTVNVFWANSLNSVSLILRDDVRTNCSSSENMCWEKCCIISFCLVVKIHRIQPTISFLSDGCSVVFTEANVHLIIISLSFILLYCDMIFFCILYCFLFFLQSETSEIYLLLSMLLSVVHWKARLVRYCSVCFLQMRYSYLFWCHLQNTWSYDLCWHQYDQCQNEKLTEVQLHFPEEQSLVVFGDSNNNKAVVWGTLRCGGVLEAYIRLHW